MDSIYPCMRFIQAASNFAGDLAIAWSTLLALSTLSKIGKVPYVLLTIEIALPFFVSLAVKAAGNLFGIVADIAEQSELKIPEVDGYAESMRQVTLQIRARRSPAGVPPTYLDAS